MRRCEGGMMVMKVMKFGSGNREVAVKLKWKICNRYLADSNGGSWFTDLSETKEQITFD